MSLTHHQTRAGPPGVYTYGMAEAAWTPTGKEGAVQKVIRADRETGQFLGLIKFEPMLTSGVHQHHGVASSLMLSGNLSDYDGDFGEGCVTMNLSGTTHDAITWNGCLFTARLEGPVTYLPSEALSDAHVGAKHALFRNPEPDAPTAVAGHITSFARRRSAHHRLDRRMLFDYAGTGDNHRFVELTLWPEMSIPTHRTTALTEWLVLAGAATINNRPAPIGSFVIMEPDTEVTISSDYGCRLLAWADGPVAWSEMGVTEDIYGF
jgi:anti-sigma factor ChrR (cupin superfamily)